MEQSKGPSQLLNPNGQLRPLPAVTITLQLSFSLCLALFFWLLYRCWSWWPLAHISRFLSVSQDVSLKQGPCLFGSLLYPQYLALACVITEAQENTSWGDSLVVQWLTLRLSLLWTWVWSLGGELRSHKLRGTGGKKNWLNEWIKLKRNSLVPVQNFPKLLQQDSLFPTYPTHHCQLNFFKVPLLLENFQWLPTRLQTVPLTWHSRPCISLP